MPATSSVAAVFPDCTDDQSDSPSSSFIATHELHNLSIELENVSLSDHFKMKDDNLSESLRPVPITDSEHRCIFVQSEDNHQTLKQPHVLAVQKFRFDLYLNI